MQTLPKSPIELSVKKDRETIMRRETRFKGKELHGWCRHMYRTMAIGFDYVDDKQVVMQRVLAPNKKYLIFLDLDETLTETNESPSVGIKGSRSEVDLDNYMQARVPPQLRTRIKLFLANISKRSDLDWFILTDNVFATTRCTIKLAFDIDTEPGTIIDRAMRSSFGDNFITKADFIALVMKERRKLGVTDAKIVFADNLTQHRDDVRNAIESARGDAFVCCENLERGLREQDINEIYRFINK